jgi:hypothetical protein
MNCPPFKLQSIETDFNDLSGWIGAKASQLSSLVAQTRPLVAANNLSAAPAWECEPLGAEHGLAEISSSAALVKVLKGIECEMQAMHAKLNDMNEVGEQVGAQLADSPHLTHSINCKMDALEAAWNGLLERMEYLSRVCSEQQQLEVRAFVICI